VLKRYAEIALLKFTYGGSALPVTMIPRLPPIDVAGYSNPVTVLVSAEELIYRADPRLSIVLCRDRLLI
jgi:hypothetical protein